MTFIEEINAIREALLKDGWTEPTLRDCATLLVAKKLDDNSETIAHWLEEIAGRLRGDR